VAPGSLVTSDLSLVLPKSEVRHENLNKLAVAKVDYLLFLLFKQKFLMIFVPKKDYTTSAQKITEAKT